jgi:hypothetical protein
MLKYFAIVMSDENGICYIDTQNLDGETNLKERHYPRGLKLPSGPEFRYRTVPYCT